MFNPVSKFQADIWGAHKHLSILHVLMIILAKHLVILLLLIVLPKHAHGRTSQLKSFTFTFTDMIWYHLMNHMASHDCNQTHSPICSSNLYQAS